MHEPLKPEVESQHVGKVTWRVYCQYIQQGAGPFLLVMVVLLLLGSQVRLIAVQACSMPHNVSPFLSPSPPLPLPLSLPVPRCCSGQS